ncbi:MAG: hypothetical protein Q7K42_06345 [Candidatus Diapherotrites archaeon]|nr:hypothetical protein [Candidatus Diapherotrites archaeon]
MPERRPVGERKNSRPIDKNRQRMERWEATLHQIKDLDLHFNDLVVHERVDEAINTISELCILSLKASRIGMNTKFVLKAENLFKKFVSQKKFGEAFKLVSANPQFENFLFSAFEETQGHLEEFVRVYEFVGIQKLKEVAEHTASTMHSSAPMIASKTKAKLERFNQAVSALERKLKTSSSGKGSALEQLQLGQKPEKVESRVPVARDRKSLQTELVKTKKLRKDLKLLDPNYDVSGLDRKIINLEKELK